MVEEIAIKKLKTEQLAVTNNKLETLNPIASDVDERLRSEEARRIKLKAAISRPSSSSSSVFIQKEKSHVLRKEKAHEPKVRKIDDNQSVAFSYYPDPRIDSSSFSPLSAYSSSSIPAPLPSAPAPFPIPFPSAPAPFPSAPAPTPIAPIQIQSDPAPIPPPPSWWASLKSHISWPEFHSRNPDILN